MSKFIRQRYKKYLKEKTPTLCEGIYYCFVLQVHDSHLHFFFSVLDEINSNTAAPTKQVMITSQNHGFAVDPDTLPANCRVTHVSLFDGSLQGFERTDRPAFCFQGHPEASPGPHDIAPLFDRFVAMMEKHKHG